MLARLIPPWSLTRCELVCLLVRVDLSCLAVKIARRLAFLHSKEDQKTPPSRTHLLDLPRTAHSQPVYAQPWDPTKKAKLWRRQSTGTAGMRSQMERIPPTNGSEASKRSSRSSKRTCSRPNRRSRRPRSSTWALAIVYEHTGAHRDTVQP